MSKPGKKWTFSVLESNDKAFDESQFSMQRNLYANTKMTKKKLTVKFKGIPRTIEEEEQYFRDRVKLAKDAPLNVDDTK